MYWTEKYFDKDYLFLYERKLTPQRTELEVDFLVNSVFEPNTKLILDIPCGYGRHSQELANQGFVVHGVDNSEAMLKIAEANKNTLPDESQKRLSYEHGDMRTYDGNGRFDAVLNLFTSIGYFDSQDENEVTIRNFCVSTRVGGLVVIDIRNLDRDIAELSKAGWSREISDGDITLVQELDSASHKMKLTYKYLKDNEPFEKTGTFQEYSLDELSRLLKQYGCEVEKTFGNFRGEPYGPTSSRLIVVARKGE